MARATECDSANWPINLTPFTRSQNLPFSEGTLPGHRLPAEPPEQDATDTGSSVANSIGPTQLEIPGRTRACRSVVLAACKGWKAINSSASSSASGFRVSCTWRRTGAIAISESAQHSCEQSSCKTPSGLDAGPACLVLSQPALRCTFWLASKRWCSLERDILSYKMQTNNQAAAVHAGELVVVVVVVVVTCSSSSSRSRRRRLAPFVGLPSSLAKHLDEWCVHSALTLLESMSRLTQTLRFNDPS